MNVRLTWRLAAFELAILLVIILIGWTGYTAFTAAFLSGQETKEQIEMKRDAFKKTQDECFLVSEHIQKAMSELNHALFRFVTQNDTSEWAHFDRKSREVKEWIRQQKNAASKAKMAVVLEHFSFSMSVEDLIEEIDGVYDRYLASASQVGNASTDRDQRMKLLEGTAENSRQLLALSGRARGRGEVIQLLQASNTQFPWKKLVLFALLVLLVLLGGWFTVMVYRREVPRMRVELMESKTIIERQQKLAHFGELAAGLAHEIRNPLTAINARLFTLQRGLPQGTAEQGDAKVIRTEISRLDHIVKDFLELARPADPKLVPLSAGKILQEVCDLLAPECEKELIQLKLESAVDEQFLADPSQLKQVLINLVRNAAESLHHDGVITVRARKDTCQIRSRATEAVIMEVEDNGPGIPAEVQERLFDPFFSTKEGGTGLGLPISASIIEKHGGEINFRTQIGHGTIFYIILPVLKGPS